jgi:hypothetical protein
MAYFAPWVIFASGLNGIGTIWVSQLSRHSDSVIRLKSVYFNLGTAFDGGLVPVPKWWECSGAQNRGMWSWCDAWKHHGARKKYPRHKLTGLNILPWPHNMILIRIIWAAPSCIHIIHNILFRIILMDSTSAPCEHSPKGPICGITVVT